MYTGATAYTVGYDACGAETVTIGGTSAQWKQNPYGFEAGLRSSGTDSGYRWQDAATGAWIQRDTTHPSVLRTPIGMPTLAVVPSAPPSALLALTALSILLVRRTTLTDAATVQSVCLSVSELLDTRSELRDRPATSERALGSTRHVILGLLPSLLVQVDSGSEPRFRSPRPDVICKRQAQYNFRNIGGPDQL